MRKDNASLSITVAKTILSHSFEVKCQIKEDNYM